MKKQWYEIILTNSEDNYTETIARVKSKGLAYIVKEALKDTYKNTLYNVTIK